MREFKITFSNDVYGEFPDYTICFVKEGDSRVVDPVTFGRIKSGEIIECGQSLGHGVTGYYNYSKKDLVNEVEETEVIVNRTIRRLGKRTKS